jgi:HlyD family secretion protein
MAGLASAVTVKAGDLVKEGDVLARLDSMELEAAVAQARAGLAAAQAAVAELKAGASKEDVAVAQAAVDSAKAQLARVKAGPTAEELAIARANLTRAESDLREAQAAYDGVRGMDIIGMLPESRALHLATQEYAVARANYDLVARGARAEDVRIAETAVAAAQAGLDRAKAAARPEAVAAAQARADQAQAAVQQSQATLAGATLTAPFAGTVAEVNLNPGEAVAPGQAVIILGDVAKLQLETNDLSETSVARVKVGQPVAVTFEALPGKPFKGTVVRIAPISSQRQGGTNYTVVVQMEGLDPALRWGMTGNIEINTAK